jgi:AraC-like DNA-binding protein
VFAVKDTLSEILRGLRLKGGIFLDARFTAPWCVISHITPEDCQNLLSDPHDFVCLHYVVSGKVYVGVGEGERMEVNEGELVLVPRNDAHVMASGMGGQPIDHRQLIEKSPNGGLARIVYGGDGPLTHLICGFLATEERHNSLLASLPRLLKVNIAEGVSRDWIESSVRFAAQELGKGEITSSSPVVGRLSEMLFAEAVRSYAAGLPEEEKGFIKGIDDQYVGRALAALHDRLDEDWTVDALADEAGLSRSAFVERFTEAMGLPPMKYITQSRLQQAKQLLRDGHLAVAQVAAKVGYEAEEAFNRAFKRQFGLPPAKWRALQS